MPYVASKPYPYLPEGKTLLYVSDDNPFMMEAKRVRNEYSSDKNHSTGAVIVKDGQIIGRGANQSALKSEVLKRFHRDKFCVRRFFKVPSGQKYWLCPGCASSRNHAEPNAIKDAKRNVKDLSGSDLYLYGHWWCCKDCWDKMIAVGIKNVYLVEGATEKF